MHDEGLVTLPKVLAAAELDNVVLVGHSDGASIALIYAGGVEGKRARGLILLAPHVFNESVCVASIRRAREAYMKTDLRTRLARYHGANVDDAFWGWNGAWLNPAFLDWNIEQYLPQVVIPVLVIQGVQDEYGTLAQIEAIEGLVQGRSNRLVLDHCAHSPHRDQPDTLKCAIKQFLEESLEEI